MTDDQLKPDTPEPGSASASEGGDTLAGGGEVAPSESRAAAPIQPPKSDTPAVGTAAEAPQDDDEAAQKQDTVEPPAGEQSGAGLTEPSAAEEGVGAPAESPGGGAEESAVGATASPSRESVDIEAQRPGRAEAERQEPPAATETTSERPSEEQAAAGAEPPTDTAAEKAARAAARAEREAAIAAAAEAIEQAAAEEEQPELRWYVLKVQTNREKSIRDALLKRIKREGMEKYFGEIIIPTERVKETRGGRTRNVERRLYPGYLMIQMALNDDTWYLVRDINGVGDFTGAGGRPVPMKDEEIRAMLGREAEKETAPAKVKVSFSRGDVVKIKEGPFENFEGTVEEIDYETGKITVLVDILGRTTPVQDLDYWQVERV